MEGYFGVIGGMGTVASTVFLNLINDIHRPSNDQDHLNYIVWNNSDVPDRTKYILDPQHHPSPYPVLKEAILAFEKMGASFIAIPCNTAHYFWDDLEKIGSIPILNMIDLVGQAMAEEQIKKVAVMATSGTIQAGIYNRLQDKYQIELILPDQQAEKEIMSLIYDNVKSSRPIDFQLYNQLIEGFVRQGAERVILACTELSVIEHEKNKDEWSSLTVDSQFVLAEKVVELGKALKRESSSD